jgi:ribosomal protein L11 methylase PrmA
MESGLYKKLVDAGLMVPHEEVTLDLKKTDDAYKIIKPEVVPFISYPYEWCFSELKDAALLTIKIQKLALEHGMSLKDSSAYNIQFVNGRPVFIDTLSFEKYKEGEPWVAYKQFCEHFLSPLVLMKYIDPWYNKCLAIYIDGIPLDLTAKLLPFSTKFSFSLLTHIHLHAGSKKHYAGKTIKKKKRSFSKFALLGFIDSLEGAVKSLKWQPGGTEWGEYYTDTNYTKDSHEHKKQLVSDALDTLSPKLVWDFGANDGLFSRIASDKGIQTISFDIDPDAIEKSYVITRKKNETHILPLLFDATNPSPDLGWNNHERMSLTSRGPCDTLMAYALIHHLAISNNVPLVKLAAYFSGLCRSLIIEWVPKDDSQVQRLLTTREDIFPNYTKQGFEESFGQYFDIVESHDVKESKRVLYNMKNKNLL